MRMNNRMLSWRLAGLVSFLLLVSAPFGPAAWSANIAPSIPLKDFSTASPCEVVRVVDGDTVVLLIDGKQTTVRLIGVDTPETVHPQKPVEAYGKEASRFLGNLLKGEAVYLDFEPGGSALDKYGRTLAYLYRAPDGLFVNLEIIRQGYGHAYTRFPFQYMDLFRAFEVRARESGKGLWDAEAGIPPQSQVVPGAIAPPEAAGTAQGDATTVYVTRTGSKYHADGCRFLSKSKIPISLKDAKARGLGPCSVCRPPE